MTGIERLRRCVDALYLVGAVAFAAALVWDAGHGWWAGAALDALALAVLAGAYTWLRARRRRLDERSPG